MLLAAALTATPTCHNLGQENDKSLEQNARHQRGRHLSWLGNMSNTPVELKPQSQLPQNNAKCAGGVQHHRKIT